MDIHTEATNGLPVNENSPRSALRKRLRSHFLPQTTPRDDHADDCAALQQSALALGPTFQRILNVFLDNLTATGTTTSAPLIIAGRAMMEKNFQRILMAERIRALALDPEPGETEAALELRRGNETQRNANQRFEEEIKKQENAALLVDEIAYFLLNLHKTPEVQSLAHELLLQGLVSIWSAFEVFAKDTLIALINNKPTLAQNILSDPTARDRFRMPKFGIDDLQAHDFDLTGKIGVILLASVDFSNLRTIHLACNAMFSNTELAQSLSTGPLQELNQARHLIVHRRAIIDKDFHALLPEKGEIGNKLSIEPSEVASAMTAAITASRQLFAIAAITATR